MANIQDVVADFARKVAQVEQSNVAAIQTLADQANQSYAGVRWLYEKEGRWEKMEKAAAFFMVLWNCNIDQIAIENPIPHYHANLPPYSQIIHPWQHGHGETKATCLWLKKLPLITPTNVVAGRKPVVHRMAPSPTRSKDRSRTYQGIANAFALQWG